MNVGTLLTKAARTFPGNLAVVHGPRRLSYAQFNARVNRLANALARLGADAVYIRTAALTKRLPVEHAAERVANFLHAMTLEIQMLGPGLREGDRPRS